MSIAGIGAVNWAAQASSKHATRQSLPDAGMMAAATTTMVGSSSAADTTISDVSASDSTAQQFTDYMKKTPAQQMQDAWLSRHGISQAQFAAMSPAEKQKIIDQMKQEIQQEAQRKAQTQPTNILA